MNEYHVTMIFLGLMVPVHSLIFAADYYHDEFKRRQAYLDRFNYDNELVWC